MTGVRHIDRYKTVLLCPPQTPSTFTSSWINFAKYSHASIYLAVLNATTVTGSAVTLNQAQDVSGTGSKAMPFNLNWSLSYTSTAVDALAQNTVGSNTFTTLTTNSASALYVIEVHDTDFDLNNNFRCLQLALATGVATTIAAVAHLYPRYGGYFLTNPSALT